MNRGARCVALSVIGISLGVSGEGGLCLFPLRLQTPASASAVQQGIGPNGMRVDPYTRTVAAIGTSCDDVRVPAWVLRDRCADDDGCQVRLASDGTGLVRGTAAARSLVIGRSFQYWTVNVSFTGSSFYVNGDFARSVVIGFDVSPSNSCHFVDDLMTDDGLYFHLEACSGTDATDLTSCTLRIDD